MRQEDLEPGDGFDAPSEGMLGSLESFIKGILVNLISIPILMAIIFGFLSYRGNNLMLKALEHAWSYMIISAALCLLGSIFTIWFARRSYDRRNGLKVPLAVAFVFCIWVPLIVTSIMYFLKY